MSEVQQSQPVTPELRQWIIDQAKAGVQPESVLESMKASGWREDVAIAALEETLRGFLDERAQGGATAAAGAGAGPAARHERHAHHAARPATARCAWCWRCATRAWSCSAACCRTRNATS